MEMGRVLLPPSYTSMGWVKLVNINGMSNFRETNSAWPLWPPS